MAKLWTVPGAGDTDCLTNCLCWLETTDGEIGPTWPDDEWWDDPNHATFSSPNYEDYGDTVMKFSASTTSDWSAPRIIGNTVYRTGKYFETDKEFVDMHGMKFGVSQAEADAGISKFSPADIQIEHAPSFLDGKLGKVNKLWREGKDIVAEYAIPVELHTLTEGQPIPFSSDWRVSDKTPTGGSFVVTPAVKDAVCMAHFAAMIDGVKHADPTAQFIPANVEKKMHHHAVEYGAECPGNKSQYSAEKAEFLSPAMLKKMQSIHDDCKGDKGAHCDDYGRTHYSENKPMEQTHVGPLAKLMAFFTGKGILTEEESKKLMETETPPTPDAKPAEQAKVGMSAAELVQFNAVQGELTEARAQLAEMKATAQFAENLSWIKEQTKIGNGKTKLTPAAAIKAEEMAKTNPAGFAEFKKIIEENGQVVDVVGFNRQFDSEGKPVERDGNTVDAAARARYSAPGNANEQLSDLAFKKADEKKIPFAEALKQISAEYPDLVQQRYDDTPVLG